MYMILTEKIKLSNTSIFTLIYTFVTYSKTTQCIHMILQTYSQCDSLTKQPK